MKLVAVGTEPVGVFAFGANATGVVAVGQLATGVIAIGQLARGVFVVGQLAVGVVALGQLTLGVAWSAGMIGIGARKGFGLVYGVLDRHSHVAVRAAVVALLALVWWLAVGQWLWHDLVREGGILFDSHHVLR